MDNEESLNLTPLSNNESKWAKATNRTIEQNPLNKLTTNLN